jgi:hypothetical protein
MGYSFHDEYGDLQYKRMRKIAHFALRDCSIGYR